MKYASQKECVFAAVCVVLATIDAKPAEGYIAKDHLTDDLRKQVISLVTEDFKEGNAPLKTVYTDEELKKYIPGMVSNHLRKDVRLNGGQKHQIKNPGIMTGNKDPQIKETRKFLKALKESNGDEKTIAIVESKLESMVTEFKKKNGKTTEIDGDQIPAELRDLYESTINAA